MVLGTGLITLNDAAMKWVVADHPVGQAVFVRGLFALLPIALLVRRAGGWRAARWHSLGGQLLCAGLLVAALFTFIFSLSRLPLGLTTIVLYSGPLFVTALAPTVLGERVGWRRWAAVLVGFAGTVLVIRPDAEGFAWILLAPLAVALLASVRDLVIRRLVARETSVSILAFSTSAVTLCALPTALLGWSPLGVSDFALLAFAGLAFGFAMFFLTDAFRYAEASLVSPFKYSGVIWAVLLGFLIWGERPGLDVLIGALVIVASGLFILRRERIKGGGR